MNELAQVFEEAQTKLWDGDKRHNFGKMYICHAIDNVYVPSQNKDKAREIIQERLQGWPTVEEYLHYEEKVPESKLTSKKVQAHRKAWLQSLVEEFKEKK